MTQLLESSKGCSYRGWSIVKAQIRSFTLGGEVRKSDVAPKDLPSEEVTQR